MRSIISLSCCIVIILTGCSKIIVTKTYIEQPMPTPTIEQNEASSSSLVSVSATPSPSAVVQNCPKTREETPITTTNGVVVMGGVFNAKLSPSPDSYLLDLKSGKKINLPQTATFNIFNLAISPNREWLAYLINHQDGSIQLLVIGSDGKTQVEITRGHGLENWFGLAGWLDDKHIFIDKLANNYPFPLVLLNPFDQTTQELLPDYPEIYDYGQSMDGWGSLGIAMTSYSHDLSLVAYPKAPREIVLWNVPEKTELANLHNSSPYGNTPLWAPDDQKLVLDISLANDDAYIGEMDELFSISRTGTINQLTHLNDYYRTAELDIQKYSWSPDSRYIAFWYSTTVTAVSHDRKYELAILDMKSGQTTSYCIVDQARAHEGYLNPPVWSPNGDQLLVRGYIGNLGNLNDSRIILIDLPKNYTYEIAKDAIPLGWMVSEP